jgi:hypothetical protein
MAWDSDTHRLITRERLRLAAPDVVYSAMVEYGAYLQSRRWLGNYDSELEKCLLKRREPTIDLALASHAATDEVLADLYSRALGSSGQPDFDKAIRLAYLANENATNWLSPSSGFLWSSGEFRRLVQKGDDDELSALLRNPSRRSCVLEVYNRSPDIGLTEVSDDRWLRVVQATLGNAALNRDDSSAHGPDHEAWNLSKSIVVLLQKAPATGRWLYMLYHLLLELNPASVATFATRDEFDELLSRWRQATESMADRTEADRRGHYANKPISEEFAALIAALYGRLFVNGKFELLGELKSNDVHRRCAYYGHGEMTIDEIDEAWVRDERLFVLAALFNDTLLLNSASRQHLDSYLDGNLQLLYDRRCEQLRAKYKRFDSAPSDSHRNAMVAQRSTADEKISSEVTSQLNALAATVAKLQKHVIWGFFILAAIELWRH